MKKLITTSILVLAMASLMAVLAGTALAAPSVVDKIDLAEEMAILAPEMRDISEAMAIIPDGGADEAAQPSFPDAGGDECVGCDEQPHDDGGNDEGTDEGVDDGGNDEGTDDGVDDGGNDEGDDEGVDDGGDDEGTDEGDETDQHEETDTPPSTDTHGGKLPNTGTQLAILGAIGLLAALTAVVAHRVLKKRMQ